MESSWLACALFVSLAMGVLAPALLAVLSSAWTAPRHRPRSLLLKLRASGDFWGAFPSGAATAYDTSAATTTYDTSYAATTTFDTSNTSDTSGRRDGQPWSRHTAGRV